MHAKLSYVGNYACTTGRRLLALRLLVLSRRLSNRRLSKKVSTGCSPACTNRPCSRTASFLGSLSEHPKGRRTPQRPANTPKAGEHPKGAARHALFNDFRSEHANTPCSASLSNGAAPTLFSSRPVGLALSFLGWPWPNSSASAPRSARVVAPSGRA